MKTAFFRFEASTTIGAGHAIRSSVIADALLDKGWSCTIVASKETYEFIKELERFQRVAPETFYAHPPVCDLLVIDNYDIDAVYEKHFRASAKKIMVIDDLANRQHECDIIIDQAYGRDPSDYKNLVPEQCKILTGSNYSLIRKEFIQFREKSLEKRKNTKNVEHILISMGGGHSKNYILKALKMIKDSHFNGGIDIVFGFSSQDFEPLKSYVGSLSNQCTLHVNPDMSELLYKADLAIGAAGSSVWERCCLGLPQMLVKTACNQAFFLSKISSLFPVIDFDDVSSVTTFSTMLEELRSNYFKVSEKGFSMIDGVGFGRILNYV